jgi:hypothetical protein
MTDRVTATREREIRLFARIRTFIFEFALCFVLEPFDLGTWGSGPNRKTTCKSIPSSGLQSATSIYAQFTDTKTQDETRQEKAKPM